MKRTTLATLALATALTGVLACGDAGKKEGNWITGTDTGTTSTATHPGSPGGEALVPETSAGVTAQLVLQEGRIVPPTTPIPPGPVVFTISNAGSEQHSLHVEGPGVSRAMDQPVSPAGTQSMSVTLQQGTYTLYCPILDHREKGETLTLTTGTDPATSTATPGSPTTDTAAPTTQP